jgi:hypothetical protein
MFTFTFNNGTTKYKLSIPFYWLLTGWLLMIVLGIFHHNVSAAVPALSYGYACLIAFTVQMMTLGSD